MPSFHFRKIEEQTGTVLSPSRIRTIRAELGWKHRATRYCALIRHANRPKRHDWAAARIADAEMFDVSNRILLPIYWELPGYYTLEIRSIKYSYLYIAD